MKFIDLRINRRFTILEFDAKKGTYSALQMIKIVPVKTPSFKIFNQYCITKRRYMFISPNAEVKEFTVLR